MGFLENDGDLIVDAVLTDTGRMRMADGTFCISKYAFGDDEINYRLYRNGNHPLGAHTSGSLYYDLEILQTPVFETFTNNTSLMHSRLMTILRKDHLYLPVLKLNESYNNSTKMHASLREFVVAVNSETVEDLRTQVGFINGFDNTGGGYIRVEQGLDTTDISAAQQLSPDLKEEIYGIEIDNRLGYIVESSNGNPSYANKRFVDDDNIAFYLLSRTADPKFVAQMPIPSSTERRDQIISIQGPRGTSLNFSIKASSDLTLSNYLFGRLGSTDTATFTPTNVYYIDTNVRVTGLTTGYRLDIPVRFVKSY